MQLQYRKRKMFSGGIMTFSFWRFLGAEGLTQVATLLALVLLLICGIVLYRIRVSRGHHCDILFFFLLFMIAGVGAWLRSSFLYWISGSFLFFFDGTPGQERSLSLPDPAHRALSGWSNTQNVQERRVPQMPNSIWT